MIDQDRMNTIDKINQLPVNQSAYKMIAQHKEPILAHWIHAIQATQLAIEKGLITIKNPQLQQALDLMHDSPDPDYIAQILELEGMEQTADLTSLAGQVLEALDLHLTETSEGYPNLQG